MKCRVNFSFNFSIYDKKKYMISSFNCNKLNLTIFEKVESLVLHRSILYHL